MKILFLPPPMKGSINLGIYTEGAAGRLVRVLHRDASAERDFTVGLNGLITHWDGKDDAGNPAPPGMYQARGFCIGDLEVEGVAIHGNDWLSDEEGPRVRKILSVAIASGGQFRVRALFSDGQERTLQCDAEGKLTLLAGAPAEMKSDAAPADACPGKDGSRWIIDHAADGIAVKQYASNGEFMRRLAIAADEPPPVQIAASTSEETILLLEKNEVRQRVRALRLIAPAPASPTPVDAAPSEAPASTWQTLFAKEIISAEKPEAALAALKFSEPFTREEKWTTRLVPNPLLRNAPASVDLVVLIDAEGSYLATANRLPIFRLAETPGLKWAVLGRMGQGRHPTVLQSDGSATEEFRASKLGQMMSFDAGSFELPAK